MALDKSSLETLIRSLEIWAAIFGVIVVVGVAGESFFGIRLLWNNWKLQRVQAGDNARLLNDVAQANARAEEARRAAAEANLELARLKLPRTLTDEQQNELADEMKAYSGQWFSLSSVEDPEAIDLVRVIGACLHKAMWEQLEPESDIRIGDIGRGIGRGLRVRVPYGASARTQGIARALTSALNDKGIASALDTQHDLHRLEVIDVLAGTKPVR